MPRAIDPANELRRVTEQITKLRARQRELIEQIGLPSAEEAIVMAALTLADEVQVFLDKVDGVTDDVTRKGVVFTKRLDRMSTKVQDLPDSDSKTGASEAVDHAVERLLNEVFGRS